MKICFYNNHHYWGGLANNGGSKTILLCIEALNELGHDAYIVTSSDKFNWFKHVKPHRKIEKKTDAIIAVSISDVSIVQKKNIPIRAYYSRPWETWCYSNNKCISIMKKFAEHGGIVMVNSKWQYDYLFDRGLHPVLVHSGMDFDKWKNVRSRPRGDRPIICCQYSTKPRKGWDEYKKLMKIAGDCFRYTWFGKPNQNIRWPEIVTTYNDADYFFVPNTLEGWYNCAAEAALCGCTLVVRDCERTGTSDFVTAENSIVYRQVGEAVGRIRKGDCGNVEDVQKRLKIIGTRKQCMEWMVKVLN